MCPPSKYFLNSPKFRQISTTACHRIKNIKGRNGLSYIFGSLPAAEAETIIHQFSHLVTRELLNDKDKNGYYPKDWISIFSRSFKNFVTGLTDPDFHDAEVRAATSKNSKQRLELLQQPRFK